MRNTRPYILIVIAWSALVGAQQVKTLISTPNLGSSSSRKDWRDDNSLHFCHRYHHPCLLKGQVV